jgi:peptidoglycan hydrolase-like protein with peptidoglycan-binding domain
MIYALTWLPSVLEAAGLKVAPVSGWDSRGRAEMGRVHGVICHHTAGPRKGNMPSLRTLVEGRSDLPGPLSQLGLGRDGTFYIVAAGRCNHAGEGSWQGLTTGNTSFIGIEAENTGGADDTPWPAVQLDAYRRGVAAILSHVGQPAAFCAGHKEYALPKGRKDDPDFDMEGFRREVAAIMSGAVPVPPLIPSIEPEMRAGQQAARPTLRRGAVGDFVKRLQQALGITADGFFGAQTEAALREFQRGHGLVPDGLAGPKTWLAVDAV